MRILIVTNYLDEKSGWGRYSLDLIKQLLKNDLEIVVVCCKKNDSYNYIEQIEIMPDALSFKKTYFLAPFYIFKFFIKNCKHRKFNLIHCLIEPYAFFTYLLSKALRIKYFLTIHGSYGVKCFYNKFYKLLQLISYKNAKKLICISSYTKKRILEYKKLNNIVVIPNGVNTEEFLDDHLCIKKKNIILGVGALKKRKGFDIVLKAVKIVKREIPDIQYNIVGNQEDKKYVDYLKKLISDFDLKKNVTFFENITDIELKDLYKESKVFVLTPVSDRYNFEGFGLVYLEANAHGLPVVGSYGNGGEDAIVDEYNGFLASAGSIESTAKKIVTLLSDTQLYEKMSQNSMNWSKKMSWNNIIKKYLEIYETK